jgi:hypothetical protein
MPQPEPIDAEAVYTSEYLVQLALDGHYVINDEIDAAIRRVIETFGEPGRVQLRSLPAIRQNASDEEVADWQQLLIDLEQMLLRENQQRAAQKVWEGQPKLPFT